MTNTRHKHAVHKIKKMVASKILQRMAYDLDDVTTSNLAGTYRNVQNSVTLKIMIRSKMLSLELWQIT